MSFCVYMKKYLYILPLGIMMASVLISRHYVHETVALQSAHPAPAVLGDSTADLIFAVNIPARFKQNITAPNVVYSVNGETGDITLKYTAGDGIKIENNKVTNTGILSLSAGDGIGVDGNKITNKGLLSLQAGDGISVEGNKVTNTGILSLSAGSGISVSGNTITNTFVPDYTAGGWTRSGTTLTPTHTGDALSLLGGGLVNAGAITGATGFTSSGTITLSDLTTGILHADFNGVLSSRALDLSSTDVTSTLGVSHGGTGVTSYTTGDMLYANSGSSLRALGIGASGQVLTVSGGVPTWANLGDGGTLCPNCLVNNPGSTQTITPTTGTATGLVVRQASGGTADIFRISDYNGINSYLRVDASGNIVFGSGTISSLNTGIFTVNPASSDPLTIAPVAQGSAAHTGTMTSEDLTADRTWIFPDQSGIVCTTAGNCTGTSSSLGGNGTSNYLAKWQSTYSLANSLLYDDGTNVGIGTTSPGYKLDVAGSGRYTGALSLGSTLGVTGATTLGSILNVTGATDLASTLGVTGATTLSSTLGVTGNTTVGGNLTVSGTGNHSFMGNVGMGTTTPSTQLHIKSSTNPGSFRIQSTNDDSFHFSEWSYGGGLGTAYLGQNTYWNSGGGNTKDTLANPSWAFWLSTNDDSFRIMRAPGGSTTNSTFFHINSSGNVGIGTTSPGAKLEIDTGTTTTVGQIIKAVSSQSGNMLEIQNSSGQAMAYFSSSGGLRFISTLTNAIDTVSGGIFGAPTQNNSGKGIAPYNGGMSLFHWAGGIYLMPGNSDGTFTTALSALPSGNVGIGTTAPMYKLDIYKTSGIGLRVGDGGPEGIQLSPASDPAWAGSGKSIWTSTGKLGINAYNSDIVLRTGTDATPMTRMTISNSGNVGIGTTSPGAKLDVFGGDFRVLAPEGTLRMNLTGTGDTSGAELYLYNSAGTLNTRISGDNGGNSYFAVGNVGIGTTSPGVKLDVAGDIKIPNGNRITYGYNYIHSDTSTWIYHIGSANLNFDQSSGYPVKFTSGSATNLYIGSAGNVGIGTTSPDTKLNVVGYASVADGESVGTGRIYFGKGALYGYGGTNPMYIRGNTGNWYLTGLAGEEMSISLNAGSASALSFSQGDVWVDAHAASAGIQLQTQGVTKLTLLSSGNVGIGTTAPGYKLDVNGTLNASSIYVNGTLLNGTSQWTTASSDIYYATGNVGIGTTAPSYKLDLAGDFNLRSGTIRLGGNTGAAGQVLASTGTGMEWVTPMSNPLADIGDMMYKSGTANYATVGNGATVSVSDVWSNYIPAYAIDSNDLSAWSSYTHHGNSPWIKIDLGSSRTVSSYRMLQVFDLSQSTQYKIETSDDNSTWTLAYTRNVSQADETVMLDTPITARYWRFTSIVGWTGSGWGIYSLELRSATSTAPTALHIGTEGQVLTVVNGEPAWADATGGSGLWSASGSNIYYTSGKVGIGTTSPTAKLQVHATFGNGLGFGGGTGEVLALRNDSGYINNATTLALYPAGSGSDFDIELWSASSSPANAAAFIQRNNAPILFYLNGSERLRFEADGKVGIGTTSPGYKLDVTGLARATGGLATYTKAGTISDTDFTETALDGLFSFDTTNHRLYFREGGSWSYIAKTAGFQIPDYEATGLSEGDLLLPYVESKMSDGALHGLYKKLSDVPEIAGVASMSAEVTALRGLSSQAEIRLTALESLGASIQKTLTSIQDTLLSWKDEFTTKLAHVTTLFAKQTRTEELCIGKEGSETCVTQTDLERILSQLASPSPSATASAIPIPSLAPDETSTPAATP